jgi:hypothetical protein
LNAPAAKEAIEGLVKVYGPFAFGVASLLIIWLAIIQPELDSKRLDFESHRAVLEKLSEVGQQSEINVRALRDTAVILDRVSTKLEKIADATR